jgi:hypothetical protein
VHLIRHCEAEHNVNVRGSYWPLATILADSLVSRSSRVLVQRDFTIRDAALTQNGRQQANLLHAKLAGNLEQEVDLIVTSPLRRTLQTTLGALPDAIERLGKETVVVFPYAQEASDRMRKSCLSKIRLNAELTGLTPDPCDVSIGLEALRADAEFAGRESRPWSWSLIQPSHASALSPQSISIL